MAAPRPLLLLALCLLAERGHGLDNGLARTPPMGWMTWERFRCTAGTSGTGPSCADDPTNCISETLVKQHADILAQPEWHSLGYRYVNIDDCWENWHRTPEGKLHANSSRFPHGMAALADYVHGKGLRLGTYNDMGTGTCGKYPGECKDELCTLPGYMTVDAETYAGWGIDSLKMVRSRATPPQPSPPPLIGAFAGRLQLQPYPQRDGPGLRVHGRGAQPNRPTRHVQLLLAGLHARDGVRELHADRPALQHLADVLRHPGLLGQRHGHRGLGRRLRGKRDLPGPGDGRCRRAGGLQRSVRLSGPSFAVRLLPLRLTRICWTVTC